jgi:hypothetical protein
LTFLFDLVNLSEIERYHADEGNPEQRHMSRRPQSSGTLCPVENLREFQGYRKIRNFVRKKSDYGLSVKSTARDSKTRALTD